MGNACIKTMEGRSQLPLDSVVSSKQPHLPHPVSLARSSPSQYMRATPPPPPYQPRTSSPSRLHMSNSMNSLCSIFGSPYIPCPPPPPLAAPSTRRYAKGKDQVPLVCQRSGEWCTFHNTCRGLDHIDPANVQHGTWVQPMQQSIAT